MAEELKSAEKYREALELLQPVMEHYRREQWRPLLDAVLSLGLKCAYLLADAAQGLEICLKDHRIFFAMRDDFFSMLDSVHDCMT